MEDLRNRFSLRSKSRQVVCYCNELQETQHEHPLESRLLDLPQDSLCQMHRGNVIYPDSY
jgi:hypothetical protein